MLPGPSDTQWSGAAARTSRPGTHPARTSGGKANPAPARVTRKAPPWRLGDAPSAPDSAAQGLSGRGCGNLMGSAATTGSDALARSASRAARNAYWTSFGIECGAATP
ncbi:hypothetical protein GCM10009753_37190 [Streptantibioticus ferralitis]